jgi:hypothetical protein
MERAPTYFPVKSLVPDKRGISRRAVESVCRRLGVREKVLDVHYTSGRAVTGRNSRALILFHAYRIRVERKKLPIATRGIDQPIFRTAHRPANQCSSYIGGCVLRSVRLRLTGNQCSLRDKRAMIAFHGSEWNMANILEALPLDDRPQ